MKMNGIGKKILRFLSLAVSAVISTVKKLPKMKPTGKVGGSVGSPPSGKSFLLRKIKIKNRLIITFNLLLVVTILITGISSYTSSTNTIDNTVKTYSLETIKQTGVVLNNQIKI